MKYIGNQKPEKANDDSSDCSNRRLTAIGGQNGWLGVFLVDSNKNGEVHVIARFT